VKFERIESEVPYEGEMIGVRKSRYRYDDGEEADREHALMPDSVSIVAHDGERVYLVRQPREAVGEEALLELPAGKLDHEGEGPLETAKRELKEEVGKGAREWRDLSTFWGSPGFCDEEGHLYLATDLYDDSEDSGENERIEIVTVPLAELDDAIAQCRDAKTLIGLLWLRAYGAGAAG
jgi:8-oxo-dGTP pyrophosphatase MutT (NUDIX family)